MRKKQTRSKLRPLFSMSLLLFGVEQLFNLLLLMGRLLYRLLSFVIMGISSIRRRMVNVRRRRRRRWHDESKF